MPEYNHDICTCVIRKNGPILVDESVSKIQKEYTLNKNRLSPKTEELVEILAPTNCSYCVNSGGVYYCGNKKRIELYKQEVRSEIAQSKKKTTGKVPRIKPLN